MANGDDKQQKFGTEATVRPAPLWTGIVKGLHPAILPIGPFRPYRYELPTSFKAAQEALLSASAYSGTSLSKWHDEYDKWSSFLSQSQNRMSMYHEYSPSEEMPSWIRGFASWIATIGESSVMPSSEWEKLSAAERLDATARAQWVEEEGKYYDYAGSQMARAEFFSNYISTLQGYVESGGSSLDELVSMLLDDTVAGLTSGKGGYLSDDDIALARKMLTDAVGSGVFPDTDVPEFLKVEPAVEEKITEWLTAPSRIPEPLGISVITHEEILKAITSTGVPAEIPEGFTEEEWLETMAIMNIPSESIGEAITFADQIKPYAEVIAERNAMIKDALAGVRDWEKPERSLGEKALFAVLQPFQYVADMMRPYNEHVSHPLAAFATMTFQRMVFRHEGGLEKIYIANREAGESPYVAIRNAWKDWDAPWGLKLAIEIPTDPLTWIPGLGLKVPAKALGKIGLKSAGDALLRFNVGLWKASDLPFDFGKGILAKMRTKGWMAPKQIATSRIDDFVGHLHAATTSYVQKPFNEITWEDLVRTLRHSVEVAKNKPQADDIFTRLGRELSSAPPMEPGDIAIWARSVGGKLTSEEIEKVPTIVDSINNVLLDEMGKVGTTAQNAKRLAIIFCAVDDDITMKRLTRDLGRFTKKWANRVENAIKAGARSETFKTAKTLEIIISSQKKIVNAKAMSKYYRHREFAGLVTALQDTVDKMDKMRWRRALDKWLVRPAAEAYLGNPAYPVWNALETMAVSLLEGVVPRQAKMEALLMHTMGLEGLDPNLIARTASDVAGFFGSAPGRAGGVHFMPGKDWQQAIVAKLPTKIQNVTPKWVTQKEWSEWMGRSYITLSDIWGNAYRRNFVIRKMAQYQAEGAYNVAGKDLSKAIKTLMGEPPVPRKKSLKLTKDVLKQDMVGRILTNNKDNVLAMKEMLTQSSLTQGEQMRILRNVGELSPQARTIGEQAILQGNVLNDYESINNFCRLVANQTILDNQPLLSQISDVFSHLATEIDAREVNTSSDLMDIFQHYEVMVDSAANIPHTMMSRTFVQADDMVNAGRFGALEKLWASNRDDMAEMVRAVDDSLESIRSKIVANKHLLKPEQQRSLEELLERGSSRDMLREATLKEDGRILDDFWSLSKAERTEEAHKAMRSERHLLWEEYRRENAVFGGGDFVMRKEYSKLYYGMPEEKLLPVDATGRDLSAYDCARAMGCNVDSLTTGIIDTVALHDRYYFIEMVKQNAARHPSIFKGFTDEKIGRVYDDIIRGLGMTPEDLAKLIVTPSGSVLPNIQNQKLLQQVEDARQKLITLKMTKALTSDEEVALHAWIDSVAGGLDNTFKGLSKDWQAVRQESLDYAMKEYYKAFADYSNETIVDYAMKMIFPYWTYHLYRWFFLPRTFIRKPGVAAAWGKYYDYSDYGWVNIPGTDLSWSPFVGSVMGVTFTLGRYDFKSYYENLGWFGSALDFIQRRGFFPGAHIMLPLTLTPIFSGRSPELGEVLPPLHKFGIEALIASNIPGVSDAATWLRDKIFHENFRDYYVETIVDGMQVEAGGKLIDGQSGADLWHKRNRGEKLTDEEQELWDLASNRTAWYTMLRSVYPGVRLREQEMLDAYDKVTQIFENYCGMSEEYQMWLWKHNMRPRDVMHGIPLEVQATLDQMWEYKIWFGRGATLMPPDVSDLMGVINEFWNIEEDYQNSRVSTQVENDKGFITPTTSLHYDGKEWRRANAENWTKYNNLFEELKAMDKYSEIPWDIEGQTELYKREGYAVPSVSMEEEIRNIYFSVQLEKKADPYTGEEDWDYLGFWLKREAIKNAMPPELRTQFEMYIRRYETPLERTFRLANEQYIKGYWATNRILLEQFTDEEKALIAEFYADATTLTRREEIRATVRSTGRQLISEWESMRADAKSALREASPRLDFWLYVFGYVTSVKTPEARVMVDAWEKDRTSILTMLE